MQTYSTHYIKKLGKSLEPFFHKVQKTILAKSAKFIKKIRTKYSRRYGALTSCQVSKKSIEEFPNKKKLYFGTDIIIIIRVIRRTNVNSQVFGFQPVTNNNKLSITWSPVI